MKLDIWFGPRDIALEFKMAANYIFVCRLEKRNEDYNTAYEF